MDVRLGRRSSTFIRIFKSINVTYDFVDTTTITMFYQKSIREMRPYFTSLSIEARKYRDDLFLMGPYYHRIFPYEKFIVLDADLKFRIDVAELYALFDQFDSQQVLLELPSDNSSFARPLFLEKPQRLRLISQRG